MYVESDVLALEQNVAWGPSSGREIFTVVDTQEGLWGYFDAGENSMIRRGGARPGYGGLRPGSYGTEFELSRHTNELEVTAYRENSSTLRYRHTFKCALSRPLW